MVKPSHYEQWRFRHPKHSYWLNYGGGPHQQLLGPAMSFGTAPATTGGLNSFGIWSAEDRKKAWQDKQEKEKKEEKEEKEEKKKRLDLRSQLMLKSCTFILSFHFVWFVLICRIQKILPKHLSRLARVWLITWNLNIPNVFHTFPRHIEYEYEDLGKQTFSLASVHNQ